MMLAIITELLDLAVELFMTSWQRRRNPTLPPITNILFISKKTQVPAGRHLAMTKSKKPKTHTKVELWSAKTAAEKLGVSYSKIRNILQSVPVEGKDPDDNRASLYDSKLAMAAAAKLKSKPNAIKWSKEWYEIEKLKRQIAKLDYDLEVNRSKYLPIEEVQKGYMAQALVIRKHWLEMINKVPPLLAGLSPSSMQVKLKDYVNETFEKLRAHDFNQ